MFLEIKEMQFLNIKLEKLFDKFYRADEARQSSTGGTGLGISNSKKKSLNCIKEK